MNPVVIGIFVVLMMVVMFFVSFRIARASKKDLIDDLLDRGKISNDTYSEEMKKIN